MSRINICGILFDNITMNEALKITENYIIENQFIPKFILVANQDLINHKQKLKELKDDLLNNSLLTIPDGYSVIYASKFLKTPLKERIAGPDFMDKMLEISSKNGFKNFFLGSKPEICEKLIVNIKSKYTNINITGYYSPPFYKEFPEQENIKIINIINNSNSDIVWVSFGCPKQELWIIKNIDKIKTKIIIGVGAAFDFHSGTIKRAPQIIQNLRLEWFYRFLQEPARLWKRYFLGGFIFLKLLLKQKYQNKKIGK